MSKRKKVKTKEARVDTPIEELTQKETLMHYNAVLIEEQNSRFKLVMEGLEVLSGKFDALNESVDRRIGALDHKIDVLSESVDRKIGNLSEKVDLKIGCLRDDMLDMERRICSKLNRLIERSDNHEYRISALEA